MMSHGGLFLFHAPELRVAKWIDAQGQARAPLTLAELGDGYKVVDDNYLGRLTTTMLAG